MEYYVAIIKMKEDVYVLIWNNSYDMFEWKK